MGRDAEGEKGCIRKAGELPQHQGEHGQGGLRESSLPGMVPDPQAATDKASLLFL